MNPKQVIDLTMTLDPTRSDWGRDNQWGVLEREKRIIIDPWIFPDRCLVEDITLHTHLGTHINSPFHQYGLIGGKQLEDFPLETFVGEAVILDMTFVGTAKEPGKKRIIKSSDLTKFEGKIKEGDIVLFFTNFKPPNTPVIGDDAARWFIDKKIKLAGTQNGTIKFGTMGKMTFLGHNIPLIEGLVNLEKLKEDRVFVIALPLPIRGIGASPARVMAIKNRTKGCKHDLKIKRIVDLSMTLDPTKPDWAKEDQWGATIREEAIKIDPWRSVLDRCLVEDITLWSHAGTHIESPRRHLAGLVEGKIINGKTIGEFPPETFVGEAVIIDATFIGPETDETKIEYAFETSSIPGKFVTAKDLARFENKIKKGDMVFFFSDFQLPLVPQIGKDAAQWLIDKGVKLVGTQDETILYSSEAHDLLLSNGIPLVECLVNLEKLKKKRVFVAAFPLKIIGIGGSPSRVIVIEEE